MELILGWGSLQLCQSLVNELYECVVEQKSEVNLHICGLVLLKFGVGSYFWILTPKSIKKSLYDVILTS